MKRLAVTGVLWLGAVSLLVLAARWLAYALAAPNPLSGPLEASAGGPPLVIVTLVSLGLAAALSILVVWLAAVGVRERQRLRPERLLPRLRLRRLALRALLLYVASSLAFAGFESYLHWRAGIGFHGLSCLVGPVHRNAIPLLAALALAAAAIAEAGGHVLAWMRAVLRGLLGLRFGPARAVFESPPHEFPSQRPMLGARPRAPPLPA